MSDLQGELQRPEQEQSQEGAKLFNVLHNNIKKATQQRLEMQLAHDRLHHNILDMLRITLGMEEQISCRPGVCVAQDKSGNVASNNQTARGGGDPQETGRMEGYVTEKAAPEEVNKEKEVWEQSLVKELESTRIQLQELREDHTLLLRQRDALSSDLGQAEKALLVEVEQLGEKLVEVQRQAEQDRHGLEARLHMLEVALEEREEHWRLLTENLQHHIHTLDKQLKQYQHFINVQAVERKQERDKFQQEIKNLEAKLRLSTRAHLGEESSGQKVSEDKQVNMKELCIQMDRICGEQQTRNKEMEQLHEVVHQTQKELDQSKPKHYVVCGLSSKLPDISEQNQDHKLNGQSICSSCTSLCEMEKQLEHMVEENDALFQEEQYGQHMATLTCSLVEAQGKLELDGDTNELRVRHWCEKVEAELPRACSHELPDAKRTQQASPKDLKFLLRRAEEGKEAVEMKFKEAQRRKEHEKLDRKVWCDRGNMATPLEGKNEQKTLIIRLREKIARLEQEIKVINGQTEKLNNQMEQREAQKKETRKEVMETLTKAGAVLQEKKEELTHLKSENTALRTELVDVKAGLSNSTDRTEKLQEEGQFLREFLNEQASCLTQLESQREQERTTVRNLHATIRKLDSELHMEQSYWDSLFPKF